MGMRIIQVGGLAKITDTMLKTSLECKVINISSMQPIFCEIEMRGERGGLNVFP